MKMETITISSPKDGLAPFTVTVRHGETLAELQSMVPDDAIVAYYNAQFDVKCGTAIRNLAVNGMSPAECQEAAETFVPTFGRGAGTSAVVKAQADKIAALLAELAALKGK